jgi:hypothetical protein
MLRGTLVILRFQLTPVTSSPFDREDMEDYLANDIAHEDSDSADLVDSDDNE